jgi:DNA replication protein DnaC
MSDDMSRGSDHGQTPRRIGPGDFAGLPGFSPAVPVPQRATGTDGRPMTANQIARLVREGKISSSRSLADALAERRVASAEAPASPRPTPLCAICKDVGYMVADVPYGAPNFGTLVPCGCKEQERRESRIRESLRIGSLRRHQRMNFKNFNPDVNPSIYQAHDAAIRFAEQPVDFLVLIGSKGTGKTHLAAAIANQRLQTGEDVVFIVVPDMLDRFRSSFHPDSEERYDQLFERVQECSLLVLDDIGTQNPTPWTNEKLFQIVNHRYAMRLPTVFTTNQDPRQVDGRIISRADGRLFDRRPWVMIGSDYRRNEADELWASVDPTQTGLLHGSVSAGAHDRGEQASAYETGEGKG